MKKKSFPVFLLFVVCFCQLKAETGYELWLRYAPVQQADLKADYQQISAYISLPAGNATFQIIEHEFRRGIHSMVGISPVFGEIPNGKGGIQLKLVSAKSAGHGHLTWQQEQSFAISTISKKGKAFISIESTTPTGLLYGSFYLLRQMATLQPVHTWPTTSIPGIRWRMLNHWDNLDRYIERGYAGISIFNWHTLPGDLNQRYHDYARANASVGINATVLTNVNANATVLTVEWLQKVKALADLFRPYGIRVFLTARFNAPMELDKLPTADPVDSAVASWWRNKVNEIYTAIPDFGGFLVKANSEGQPGPQNYGRSHHDGANMLAAALKPHGGIVIWRAFVYSNETPEDRFKQAYNEFVPLDGQFAENVIIQVKNGPIDFQPREPFHPLFGAMPKTQTAMEFQLTQEYLGFATHLVYLAPMFREVLDADTYRPAKGNTVADIISGKTFAYNHTVMAGVANIGNDMNWCGHPFAQANWYLLGRVAWDPMLSSEVVAKEWIAQTFSRQPQAMQQIAEIMMASHENLVNYMTPLGLHHIMGNGHHYGPAPWFDKAPREDWNCTYFHRADDMGVGFDRTAAGSNALQQYAPYWQQQWGSLDGTASKWLLWFHHVPWNHQLQGGKTFWEQLCLQYQQGVNGVSQMRQSWINVQGFVDKERFAQVNNLLAIQLDEAEWWRDACISYFQGFSKQKVPEGVPEPKHALEYYKSLMFPYAPGNGK